MSLDKQLDHDDVLAESLVDQELQIRLDSPERLKVLADLDILDAPTESSFKLLAELGCLILEIPICLISLVTDDRQFFVGASGLGEPWATDRQTPLSHSFCQEVVKRNEPLVINDARNHDLVCDNMAVEDLNVVAYLGVPLIHEDVPLGSFCAIDTEPRKWTKKDLVLAQKLSALTVAEFVTRKSTMQNQLRLENQLRQSLKMEAIGQLTAGVAHDFSNVLGAVQIYSDLIQVDCNNPAKTLTHLQQIQSTIDSAKGVVQQLLNWSRPDQIDQTPICLAHAVNESLPLLNAFLSPQVRLVFEDDSGSGVIMANLAQIQQVLFNLCGNAEHAMRNTGGDVEIKVHSVELDRSAADKEELDPGRYVVLTVSDKGYGIPANILHRIHDPYFTTKPVGEGTGLGLWTVFGIAQAHQASVRVESVVDKGSTFQIFFPESSETTVEASTATVATEGAANTDSKKNYRLMIVDDDEVIVQGMAQQLELSGYLVSAFSDPQEALKAFEKDPSAFDILVTDQIMPNLYGDELIQEVKRISDSILTIVCTGYSPRLSGDQGAVNPAKAHGADAHCKKPYRFKVLTDAIEGLLRPSE